MIETKILQSGSLWEVWRFGCGVFSQTNENASFIFPIKNSLEEIGKNKYTHFIKI